jgi:hypothetical protein
MDFFFNGFMAAFGAVTAIMVMGFVWEFGAYIIVALLPKVLPKKMQAKFIRDLKQDPYRNAKVLRAARKLGWHEE